MLKIRQIEQLLEGTIEYTGTYEGDDACSFSFEVTIGDDVYSVDTSTGIFSKGDAIFKLADERMLRKFMMLIYRCEDIANCHCR